MGILSPEVYNELNHCLFLPLQIQAPGNSLTLFPVYLGSDFVSQADPTTRGLHQPSVDVIHSRPAPVGGCFCLSKRAGSSSTSSQSYVTSSEKSGVYEYLHLNVFYFSSN